jgi:soluble lytic murein transglycosylase-like protein
MKLLIKGLLTAVLFLAVSVNAQIVEAPVAPKETVQDIIHFNAKKYNVSESLLTKVIACESSFVTNARGDGGHSRGLVQIHNLYHPTVTDAQADDPTFAIDFLASYVAQGKGHLWTCHRMITGIR